MPANSSLIKLFKISPTNSQFMENKFYKPCLNSSGSIFLLLIILLTSFWQPASAFKRNIANDNLTKIKCSIQVSNQSLEQVFNMIQKQTPYNIVCIDKSGFLQKKVSINALNSNLGNVLEKMSSTVPFTYNEVSNKIIVKPSLITKSVEERIIRGKVTDSKNKVFQEFLY